MSEATIIVPLSIEERGQLIHYREIIIRNMHAAREWHEALREVHARNLYREHGTFAQWCATLGIHRSRAYQLMAHLEVVESVSTRVDNPPQLTERQSRELARVPADDRPAVLERARELAPEGEEPSARLLGRVVDERLGAAPPADEDEQAAAFMADFRRRKAAREGRPTLELGSRVPAPPTAADDPGERESHDEWYTRPEHIAAVREVLGNIELDPASCERANATVGALRYFTAADDGLSRPWRAATVFANPPYLKLIAPFVNKLLAAYATGDVRAAILLVNANTGSSWFEALFDYPVCFVRGRVRFEDGSLPADAPRKPHRTDSAFIYMGPHQERFIEVFSKFGPVVSALHPLGG